MSDHHERKELAKQLVAYADAITAFSFVQSAAFGLALAQTEVHNSVLRVPHILLGVVGAYILYMVLVGLCWLGEKVLLRHSSNDPTTSRWRTIIWIWRLVVLLLALALSVLSVGLTVKEGLRTENKTISLATPCPVIGPNQSDQNSQIQSQIKNFTGWLVAVGFLQSLVLALQLWLIRRQDRHFRNSERAWLMVELKDHEKGLLLQEGASRTRGSDEQKEYTSVRVKLTCENEGRSPAWVENIYGRMDIVAEVLPEDDPQSRHLNSFGTLAPIGPNGQKSTTLDLRCEGKRKGQEILSVYVVVEYRDVFGIKRMTTAGYSIMGFELYRQEALPGRNRNT